MLTFVCNKTNEVYKLSTKLEQFPENSFFHGICRFDETYEHNTDCMDELKLIDKVYRHEATMSEVSTFLSIRGFYFPGTKFYPINDYLIEYTVKSRNMFQATVYDMLRKYEGKLIVAGGCAVSWLRGEDFSHDVDLFQIGEGLTNREISDIFKRFESGYCKPRYDGLTITAKYWPGQSKRKTGPNGEKAVQLICPKFKNILDCLWTFDLDVCKAAIYSEKGAIKIGVTQSYLDVFGTNTLKLYGWSPQSRVEKYTERYDLKTECVPCSPIDQEINLRSYSCCSVLEDGTQPYDKLEIGDLSFAVVRYTYADNTTSTMISCISEDILNWLDNPSDYTRALVDDTDIRDEEIDELLQRIVERKKLTGPEAFRPTGNPPWLVILSE